jgi:tetratricopeptide (TPR) repeat protein
VGGGEAIWRGGQSDQRLEHRAHACLVEIDAADDGFADLRGCRQVFEQFIGDEALGSILSATDNLFTATDYLNKALSIARELGDVPAEEQVLVGLGNIYVRGRDLHRAVELLDEALVLARAVGDRQGETLALANLGYAHQRLGNLDDAIDFYGII